MGIICQFQRGRTVDCNSRRRQCVHSYVPRGAFVQRERVNRSRNGAACRQIAAERESRGSAGEFELALKFAAVLQLQRASAHQKF